MTVTINDFNYELPASLIADVPLSERSASRLLAIDKSSGSIAHHQFKDIINLIQPNDLLVLNNTKVIPARLLGHKDSGGKLECLVERVIDVNTVLAHVRSSKSPKPGTTLIFADGVLQAKMIERAGELFKLKFLVDDVIAALEQFGKMPLPPYIQREDTVEDRERYQTVFAEEPGAVAAPTAGLHFDEILLQTLRDKGVAMSKVTLHVGAGTFQPVRCDDIKDHHMHSEWIDVGDDVIDAVNTCRQRGGRVIAVGTTVVRALETAALSGQLQSLKGETDIFIYPGKPFHCIDALITNFHLPKSTLLMLVSAFAGTDLIRQAYQQAINNKYRFFSYGDAMFIA